MKHLLEKGNVSLLLPEGEGGGLSEEVHLVQYDNQKYVVRRCETLKKAKIYEEISKRFEKHGFLPKFLERHGKDVFYEYIEGRDLTKEKETLKTFEEIGKICAHINKVKVNGHISTLFNRQLRELHTGAFKFTKKEAERRRRNNIKHVKLKPVFNERKYKDIKGVYNKLKKKLNPELTLEANDVAKGNFRLGKDNKVYFVDIEAIKPKVKGFGIGKLYLRWAKEKKQQQAFAKGYTSVSSLKFFTEEYKDFIYISFLIQRINYGIKIHNRDFFEKELVLLDKILEKYTVQ